jgi:hypothetical protein
VNGPQHLAAAGAALEKAESESGPRGDLAQFNKHMRLHAAHLAMAQFALDVARTVGAEVGSASAEALSANAGAWITEITEDGAK